MGQKKEPPKLGTQLSIGSMVKNASMKSMDFLEIIRRESCRNESKACKVAVYERRSVLIKKSQTEKTSLNNL